MSLRRRIAIAALAAPLLLVWASPVAAAPGDDSDYPTWAEVEAAKGSEAAAQTQYEKLQGALQRAQAESASASLAAIEAAQASRDADAALAEAITREGQLDVRLGEARDEVSDNGDALGRTVAWLYRDGTGLARYSALAMSENPEEFMAKLGTAEQVTGTWNTLVDRATEELNTVSSLEAQASAAKQERETLADEASAAAQEAEQKSRSANAAVTEAAGRSDTIYAQLASLRGTSADAERRYQLGVQVAADAREQEQRRQLAAQSAPASAPSGGSGTAAASPAPAPVDTGAPSGGVAAPSIPAPTGPDPAGDQAYASSVLGAYGWGPEQFGCLVSLWNGESNWRSDAMNPWSGAYGIPQSLPAEKMAAAGADWRTNGHTQVDWGLAYISAVYGSPCNAWNTWLARSPHWY